MAMIMPGVGIEGDQHDFGALGTKCGESTLTEARDVGNADNNPGGGILVVS